jgi:hypothetical protein
VDNMLAHGKMDHLECLANSQRVMEHIVEPRESISEALRVVNKLRTESTRSQKIIKSKEKGKAKIVFEFGNTDTSEEYDITSDLWYTLENRLTSIDGNLSSTLNQIQSLRDLVRLATVSIAFGVMKVITNATPSNRFSS